LAKAPRCMAIAAHASSACCSATSLERAVLRRRRVLARRRGLVTQARRGDGEAQGGHYPERGDVSPRHSAWLHLSRGIADASRARGPSRRSPASVRVALDSVEEALARAGRDPPQSVTSR
jgi:hypothetical protein